MRTRLALVLATALLAWPIISGSAFSAGGGGGGEGGGGNSGGGGGGDTTQKCTGGKVWDKKQDKCVEPQRGQIDDDSIYEAGRDLATVGRYDEAINVLSIAANKQDTRILNYLGYSHRKAGRITVGLGYYQEALRINPDFTLAREYLGEAYLSLGDVASAQNQLNEIEKRCGKGCEEYVELSDRIAKFGKI